MNVFTNKECLDPMRGRQSKTSLVHKNPLELMATTAT
jgi:hypothetical protein